jgi:four helix bundle protein
MGDNELSERLFRFANSEETQGAVSRADFGNKVGISLKEMRESNYWLRILNELYLDNSEIVRLKKESFELRNILSSICTKVSSKK